MSDNPFLTNLLGRSGRLVRPADPPPEAPNIRVPTNPRVLEPGEVVLVRVSQYGVSIALRYSDGCMNEYPLEMVQVASDGCVWDRKEHEEHRRKQTA